MRCVKLDHVEAASRRHLCRGNELLAHNVHVLPVHGFWHRVARCPCNGRCGQQRPVSVLQRRVHLLPSYLGRPFAPGMSDLHAEFRIGFGMDKIYDPLPGCLLFWGVKTWTAGCDPSLGADAGHFGIKQTGAALCAFPVMHHMPVGGEAVDGLILRHRRDDQPVLQMHVAKPVGGEHWRTMDTIGAGLLLEPHFR